MIFKLMNENKIKTNKMFNFYKPILIQAIKTAIYFFGLLKYTHHITMLVSSLYYIFCITGSLQLIRIIIIIITIVVKHFFHENFECTERMGG